MSERRPMPNIVRVHRALDRIDDSLDRTLSNLDKAIAAADRAAESSRKMRLELENLTLAIPLAVIGFVVLILLGAMAVMS